MAEIVAAMAQVNMQHLPGHCQLDIHLMCLTGSLEACNCLTVTVSINARAAGLWLAHGSPAHQVEYVGDS